MTGKNCSGNKWRTRQCCYAQRRRAVVSAVADTDLVQQGQRAGLRLGLRDTVCQLRQHDVFQRGKFRQQVVELIDKPHIAPPHACAFAIGLPCHIGAANLDRAGVGRVEQTRDMQQR